MITVLVPWLVLRRTDNAAYAGLVNSAALVAAVVSLLFGAAIVDRWNRRNLSVGADLLSAVAVVAIPVADWLFDVSITMIVVLVAIGALFDGPGRSAREAMRPDIATRSGVTLERTNALGEVVDGVGNVAGPAGAGVAVAAIGLSGSFWLSAALLAAGGLVFLLVKSPAPRPAAADAGDGDDEESYLAATVDGFRRVWRDPVLRATAISASLFGFFLAPIVLVLTASFESQGRAAALGGVLAAFSIGAILGTVAYAAVGEGLRRRPLVIAGSAAAAVGIGAMAALLENYVPLIIVTLVAGIVVGPLGPVFSVIIQQRAPDAIRGRVLATLGTLELVAAPLSLAIAGVRIEVLGTATSMGIIAAGGGIATLYTALAPGLRRIEAADLVADPN